MILLYFVNIWSLFLVLVYFIYSTRRESCLWQEGNWHCKRQTLKGVNLCHHSGWEYCRKVKWTVITNSRPSFPEFFILSEVLSYIFYHWGDLSIYVSIISALCEIPLANFSHLIIFFCHSIKQVSAYFNNIWGKT